jgi:hypothetical protein
VLFQGIAIAPKLRSLDLQLKISQTLGVSAQQLGEMLANALKEHQNNSLELLSIYHGQAQVRNQMITQIILFNSMRRRYQNTLNKDHSARNEQLVQALIAADETDNHHFCFWLVRNHAGDLCCGRGGQTQAESRQRKRKLITT